jgi:hypothetical protein
MFKAKKKPKITSLQFELEVKKYLESTSGKLRQFITEHRETIDGHDGTYNGKIQDFRGGFSCSCGMQAPHKSH